MRPGIEPTVYNFKAKSESRNDSKMDAKIGGGQNRSDHHPDLDSGISGA
jgi:hypothetical protein